MQPRNLVLFVFASILCSTLSAQVPSTPARSGKAPELLSADTPKSTVLGNAFIAPKDWSLSVKRRATILQAPEGNSGIALVDVDANGPEQALAAAWQVYKPEAKWPVKVSNDLPNRDGWSRCRRYEYLTSPNEKRGVDALVLYSGTSWTVAIEDLADAVAEKRGSQAALIVGRLLPKDYSRESFAGKKAKTLDKVGIAELGLFVEQGRKELGIPGVALGLVQNGKVIFADGFGIKELGGSEKPDGDTRMVQKLDLIENAGYWQADPNGVMTT